MYLIAYNGSPVGTITVQRHWVVFKRLCLVTTSEVLTNHLSSKGYSAEISYDTFGAILVYLTPEDLDQLRLDLAEMSYTIVEHK